MKTTKKILTLVLALALIFALAAPAFAAGDDARINDRYATSSIPSLGADPHYIQGSASNYAVAGEFTVYLYIYSGKYYNSSTINYGPIDYAIPVTMGSPNSPSTSYTVYNVLSNAQTQYNYLSFNMMQPYQGHSSWIQGVTDSNISSTFEFPAMILYYTKKAHYCGWMFRINGNIPYFTHTVGNNSVTEGCTITDAYVSPNDVINLYYCNIYNQSYATKPIYILRDSYTYDSQSQTYSATFQVLMSECYKNLTDPPAADWTLVPWYIIADEDLDIKVDGTSQTIHIGSDGKFTLTGLSSGTHTLQAETALKTFYVSTTTYPYFKIPKEIGFYCRYSF